MEISKKNLIDSIINKLDSLEVSDKTQEKALDIVKMLSELYFIDFNTEDPELLRQHLFGYAYFVSMGKDFSYDQSYMNTKINEYQTFCININSHLDLILKCANTLIKSSKTNSILQKYEYVFDELIVLFYEKESKNWQFSMKWSNFSSIVGWKKDCGILQATKNNEQNCEVVRFTEKDNTMHFPIEDLILILNKN